MGDSRRSVNRWVMVVTLALGAASWAQGRPAEPQRPQVIRFDDDVIEAGPETPLGQVIAATPRRLTVSLMVVRETFRAQVLNSVHEL